MIGIFQQLSAAEKVSAFLTHHNLEVRKLAATTLQELSAFHLSEQVLNAWGEMTRTGFIVERKKK